MQLVNIHIFVFQPVFKMETFEEDMEIAEVIQGFVYLFFITFFVALEEKDDRIESSDVLNSLPFHTPNNSWVRIKS